MPTAAPPTAPVANAKSWDPPVIFSALGDPVRWRLFLTIAHDGPKAATQLSGTADRRLDATLKHLVVLRGAGLLVTSPDPVDGRRMLYSLAPLVPVAKSEAGTVIDFGFCLLRL